MGLWKLIKPLTSDNTNLITNPSVETATTGYTAKGTNAVAQSTDYQFRGLYSLKCTYQDTANLWGYGAAGLSTSTTYYLKGRVYVPSDWDGGNIYLGSESFTSATTTTVSQYTDGTSPTGAWILLETTLTIAADASGNYLLVTSSAPTAGRFVYFDCLYISTQDADYFDGDEPGAEWSGTVHASTSVMSAKSRRGGAVVNLDDYSTYVESHAGTGMPQVINRLRSLALQHGAEYLGYDVGPRLVTLVRTTIGTSLANMHSQRKALINALKGDLVGGAQPIKLRYTGAHSANEAEINVVYDAGLEFGGHRGFSERGAVRLLANDPYFYSLNDQAATLNTLASDANTGFILSRQAGNWSNMDTGANDLINAMAVGADRKLYVGGDFTAVGSGATSAARAAYWTPSTGAWSAMGTGPDDIVYAVAADSNGDVYYGGLFLNAGGASANYIAKWNGSAWSALGTGLNGPVYAILISKDGSIYVGGGFTTAGGGGANYIAKWSGSAWSALGSGLNGDVKALAEDASGNIYVGGAFTTAGGSSANYVAKWNGSAWSALGSGMNTDVESLEYASDGTLYAAGIFTTAGGNTVNYVAQWNGASWSALGTGLNSNCYMVKENNGNLYLSGDFTQAGGIDTVDGLAIWNGSSYVNADVDFPASTIKVRVAFDNYAVDPIEYYSWNTGTATAYYGETTTVTNSGTAEAYPVLKFKNTAARGNNGRVLFLRNETTGDTLYLDYSIAGSDVLTIDLRPGKKSVTSSQYGNVIGSAVLAGSDLATFSLAPGANVLTLFISESGSPAVSAFAVWRPRHWSIDGVAA